MRGEGGCFSLFSQPKQRAACQSLYLQRQRVEDLGAFCVSEKRSYLMDSWNNRRRDLGDDPGLEKVNRAAWCSSVFRETRFSIIKILASFSASLPKGNNLVMPWLIPAINQLNIHFSDSSRVPTPSIITPSHVQTLKQNSIRSELGLKTWAQLKTCSFPNALSRAGGTFWGAAKVHPAAGGRSKVGFQHLLHPRNSRHTFGHGLFAPKAATGWMGSGREASLAIPEDELDPKPEITNGLYHP